MGTDWSSIDSRIHDPSWYESRTEFMDAFRKIRDEDPIHWADAESSYGRSFWFITRYDDVKAVINDPGSFSSRHFWSVGRPPRSPRRLTLEQRYELGMEGRVANLDPPMHTYLRRPMNPHFSVPAIAKLTDDVQQFADEIVAELRGRSSFEVVEDVAALLPMRVVMRLLGVPEEDWDGLRLAAGRYAQSNDPRFLIDGDPVKTAEIGLRGLVDFAMDLADKRQREPQDDFATVVTQMSVEGVGLSNYEMRGWFSSIILGGTETSRNAIGVGIWQLLSNPAQREIFLDAPLKEALNFTDEVIRWTSPARSVLRVASRNIEMGGKEIRQGDWVQASLISANHDERAFDDPGRFDLRRTPNDHLGLGDGIHKCLGRNLVRLEFAILAKALLKAFPDLKVEVEPKWIRDPAGSGLASLNVRTGGAA